MSSIDIYQALRSFIQADQSIDLWNAAKAPALQGMEPVLSLFGIHEEYLLQAVSLVQSPDGSSGRLTGTGSFPRAATFPVSGTPPYQVKATLDYFQANNASTIAQGENTFSLTLALITDWGFSDFFGPLPLTLMEVPSIRQGITWYPSVLDGMKVRNAVFKGQSGTDKLGLTGLLLQPSNQHLLDKTPMIRPWPLRLAGTIILPDSTHGYPLVDLDARGNDTVISGARQTGVQGPEAIALNNPGLTLLVQPLVPPQPGREAFSTLELFGNFTLGEVAGRLSTLILSTGDVWNFTVRFDKSTSSLWKGLTQLPRLFGFGNEDFPIPMNFPVLSDFYIDTIDVDLEITPGLKTKEDPETTSDSIQLPSFSLLNLGITIRSDKTWNPPVPFVTLNNVGARWVWGWTMVNSDHGVPEKRFLLTGSVFGRMNFKGGTTYKFLPPVPEDAPGGQALQLVATDDPVKIGVSMSIPAFIISGSLADESYIPIGEALRHFFGHSGPPTGSPDMNITELRFSADPLGQNYFASAAIFFGDPRHPVEQSGWKINLFITEIILESLEFEIALNNGQVSGGISGTFFLAKGDPTDYTLPRILLSAEYPVQDPETPEGWILTGLLYPGTSICLTTLVYQFIYGKGQLPPSWMPEISVDRLSAVITTGSSGSTLTDNVKPTYVFGAAISARWAPNIFGTTLKINAAASVDLQKLAGAETATGTMAGTFSVNKIQLTASLALGVPEPTYLFKVQFDQLWLQATTSWRNDKDDKDARHQVISLQLGGVTLGDMLEYLVNLAAPTLGFRLDSPWDVLKKIDLSRFLLTIDPKENTVEFVFNANVDLVLAHLDSIGVKYTKKSGEPKVELLLTGRFLNQEYNSDRPLSWDVINDPPPAVPGKGTRLVNLRYLGIGQRVGFTGALPDTVAGSIADLRKYMTPPNDEGSPLPATMRYSAESQWLIGLDVQVMEAIDLAIIFNDPVLYGLSIALGGERAGALAGLRFEILYKKVTDTIGMFRIEFQVPDLYRTIQLGAVSITLGIVVIEIYTNGNFKIDLGFPYNQNFDRSFSMQASIFIGRGGFYLGVLNGDTSTQVPRISNGTFAPVIELGVGIAAGVGREIKAGVFSGGAYVELEVIFQGVLAWFNPSSNGAPAATFFKCQGIAALHGKVYGSVDFAVVKASVTLEAYAQVSIVYESYQPMLITFAASVRAEASIKIFFITIHFSFEVQLHLSFTVGSAQPTPWILSNNDGNTQALNQHRRLAAMRATHHATQQRLRLEKGQVFNESDYVLDWQPLRHVFPDSPRNAHLTLMPLFTVADMPVNWDATIPDNHAPVHRAAFVLFADTGCDTEAKTAADCAVRSGAHSAMTTGDGGTSLLAADILTQGLLSYAIYAVPGVVAQNNTITAGQLELLLEQLDMPETASGGLSVASLAEFFETNINLWISGDLHPRPKAKSVMVVPLPPFLQWSSPQGGEVNFSEYNKIGPWYEWEIARLLGSFSPVGGGGSSRPVQDTPDEYESFSSLMFRDFCIMLIRSGIKEMQQHLDDTTVTVSTVSGVVQSLEQLAYTLPSATVRYIISAGDTAESVAAALGATPEELVFLNPRIGTDLTKRAVGTSLAIVLGIAPEILGIDNAEKSFALNQLPLGTLVHQAANGETLLGIATLFQVPSVSKLLAYADTRFPVLSSSNNVLRPGATFMLRQRTFYNAPADFDQLRTAALFFVRYLYLSPPRSSVISGMANWYAQSIAQLNESLLITSAGELPPGQLLDVPNKYEAAYNKAGHFNIYTTMPGDTLERIGLMLVFQQDFGNIAPDEATQWPDFRSKVVSAGIRSWSIPATPGIKVEAGLSIEGLVRQLVLDASRTDPQPTQPSGLTYDWAEVAEWLGPADVLVPLAAVTVPEAQVTAEADEAPLSFQMLNTKFGLSFGDAATRLKGVNNLYASGTHLAIKHLPAQNIDVLMSAVLQGTSASFISIIHSSSRLLMSGLRLPNIKKDEAGHSVADEAGPLPLYDLTGQQFSVPLNALQPTENALSLSLSVLPAPPSKQPWIKLFNSVTVQDGITLEQLETTYPDLLLYNPGLPMNYQPGMVLLTAPVSNTLDYSYTNADLLKEMPAAGLSVVPLPLPAPAPAALPLSGTVPRTYGLEHRIEVQSPVALPIPQRQGDSSVTGNPGLWMLPADLRWKARAGNPTLYEVLATQRGAPAGSAATELLNSTFGTLLPFRIKRLADDTSQFGLAGVDTDKRNQLLLLSSWLVQQHNRADVHLLLSPAPDAANTSGLTVLTPPAEAFILKTNLSTDSAPPSQAREARAESDNFSGYFATLSSLADFLVLLWEGSTVGGAGYYFSPGQQLPVSAFDSEGYITLQLLVIPGTQQAVAEGGRSLLPFNNCVLIGAGTDSAQLSVFIQSSGSTDPGETVTQALVPPGSVGFELLVASPAAENISTSNEERQLQQLYSLLTFRIASTPGSPFDSSSSWMPVLPTPRDGERQQPWQRDRAMRKVLAAGLPVADSKPKPYWYYTQVVPLWKFIKKGTTRAAPDVFGLPPAQQDPYQGFGTQQELPEANFVFGFGDVLGNRTSANGNGRGTRAILSGYTDRLLPIGEWPATARSFSVVKAGAKALLSASVSLRPSELLPSPAQKGDALVDQWRQQQLRFGETYYQLIQPGMSAWLVTSLQFVPDQDRGNRGVQVDCQPLWRFAAGAYVLVASLGLLEAAKPAGATTIGDIISQFGVRYAELATANADNLISKLFGPILPAVPAYFSFVEHLSINALVRLLPAGWPTVSTTVLSLPQNTSLPLRTGSMLNIPDIPERIISTGEAVPTPSLQAMATASHTSPIALATENALVSNLQHGFVFTVEADDNAQVAVTIGETSDSFEKLSKIFAGQGVNRTVAALATLYQGSAGLYSTGIELKYSTYLVNETIYTGVIQPTPSLQALATANRTTPNAIATENAAFFNLQPGFEFTVTNDHQRDVVVTVDSSNNSLGEIVAVFLQAGVHVTVEGLASRYQEYNGLYKTNQSLFTHDTLSSNCSGVDTLSLAAANLDTLDIFEPGTLVYFGNFANVGLGASSTTLKEFSERYACPMELLLINNSGFVLPQASAFLLPGTLAWPAQTDALRIPYTIRADDTLDSIVPHFNFNDAQGNPALQLASLNEHMPGTLLAGARLSILVGGIPYYITAGANSSFASVLASLQLEAPLATLQDVVSAIAGLSGVLNAGGLFLCPLARFASISAPQAVMDWFGVSPAAFALTNTAIEGLIAPSVSLHAPIGSIRIITQTNDTFNSLIARFASAGVIVSADEIATANQSVAFLQAQALLPPAPVKLETSLEEEGGYEHPVCPLEVSVRLLRPTALIHPDFKTDHGTGPVEMAESAFPAPVKGKDEKGSLTYDAFIANMILALPRLRLGTAKLDSKAQDLWQVAFDNNGIKEVAISGSLTIDQKAQPRFFAMKPLYKSLVTRTINVSLLGKDGLLDTAKETAFHSVDVEPWAHRFLKDLDRFLSGTAAMAVYADPEIRIHLESVLDAKRRLASAVAAGLDSLLDLPDPDKSKALVSAVKAWEQELGVSLGKAYETSVIVQYDSCVQSAWQTNPELLPAKLYGQANIIAKTIPQGAARSAYQDKAEPLPAFSMLAAKTNLAESRSYVNFLLALDKPSFHKHISGSFCYQISHLEFNIADRSMPQGFNSSDWLTFLPLLTEETKPNALETYPGLVDVPIPLRTFPGLPHIISQQVHQSFPDENKEIGNLALWNYLFEYTHEHAEQDCIIIKTEFNLAPPAEIREFVDADDLFNGLAQYITIADQLWSILSALNRTDISTDHSLVRNGVQTFARLATSISNSWPTRLEQDRLFSLSAELITEQMTTVFSARVESETLMLNLVSGQPGPNNLWPDICMKLPSGKYQPLTPVTLGEKLKEYALPAEGGAAASGWPVFRIVWNSLNVAKVQNARSQMNVQRNQNLLNDASTNPDFIFTTDIVMAPDTVAPLNNFGSRFYINGLGSNLSDALNASFQALFGSAVDGQKVTIELQYGFELVSPSDGSEGLITYLPIGLYPGQTLSESTAIRLNNIVMDWKGAHNPDESGGEWVFSLKLYSTLSDSERILLNIDYLVYKI